MADGSNVIIAPVDGKIWEPCQPIRIQHVLPPDNPHRRTKRRAVSKTSVASQPTPGRHVATHADGNTCVPTRVRIRTYPLGRCAPPILSDYFHQSVRTSSAAVEGSCRPGRETVRKTLRLGPTGNDATPCSCQPNSSRAAAGLRGYCKGGK